MDLIIGGFYQGKLEYAKEKHGLLPDDISFADEKSGADFSRRCICDFEKYLLYAFRQDASRERADICAFPLRDDAVIIANDISCGVVPMEPETRAWREYCGRTLSDLAGKCDSVTRVFCGIPMRIK